MDYIVDTHSHLFDEAFDEDRAVVMERCLEAGVAHVLMPNIDSTTVERLMTMCADYPEICFPMMGLHPTSVSDNYEEELSTIRNCLVENKDSFVAIGEIGVDLYWDKTYLSQQLDAFERQVRWALDFDLPIAIHCRSAFDYIYKVLKNYSSTSLRGVFHSVTGDGDEIGRMLEFKNFCLGVNGIVTFKKSLLPSSLLEVPLDRILLETDSPYLSPVPFRGKRNESSYVVNVLRKLSEIYELPESKVAKQTTINAFNLFRLSKKKDTSRGLA